MKTITVSFVRTAAFTAALFAFPGFALAADLRPSDPAAQSLLHNGRIPVKNAGPYVVVGSYQIQVTTRLGHPAAKLADGTWLYRNYEVEDSDASGTLVVMFDHGRVSDLALVTPTVATAMMAPKKSLEKIRTADRN